MTHYLVTWAAVVEGRSPDHAAREARRLLADPDSTAAVFDVALASRPGLPLATYDLTALDLAAADRMDEQATEYVGRHRKCEECPYGRLRMCGRDRTGCAGDEEPDDGDPGDACPHCGDLG